MNALFRSSGSKYDPSTSPDRRVARSTGRPRPKELNHLFVSNVRFWSMLSIVALHSGPLALQLTKAHPQLENVLAAPFKFATIGFFLISGFLLGERVDRRNPVEYFMRRVKRVFVPWLLWFAIMCAVYASFETFSFQPGHSATGKLFRMAAYSALFSLLDTPFWFVPNLLLSIAILLTFRRHLYTLKFGAVLLAANLVYVVNIYAQWFTSRHTEAAFGFVFYLWLGSYIAQNFDRISAVLARIPTRACLALALLTLLAAFGESQLLTALGKHDSLNTLRLSNQIFSLSMVLLIFRLSRATWPSFIDVRRHTFGIYLAHSIVLQLISYSFLRMHPWSAGSSYLADAEALLLWIALSVVTYGCSLLVAAWLANSPALQWTVGLAPQDSKPRSAPELGFAHATLPAQ